MTPAERMLYDDLNVDNIEYRPGGTPLTSKGTGTSLMPQSGNPLFRSQIDIEILTAYTAYDIDLDTGTNLFKFVDISSPIEQTPAQIPSNLKNKLMFCLFGNADFQSGYARVKESTPLTNWVYGEPVAVRGKDLSHILPVNVGGIAVESHPFLSRAVNEGIASIGDVVIPMYLQVDVPVVGGTTATMYIAEVVIKCTSVAYATLLAATNSDRFTINMVRYTIPDDTKISQYSNQIVPIRQSLFGKLSSDKVSANIGTNPKNYQNNIVDIGIIKPIDKETSLSCYINYDVEKIVWSLFIETTQKITAK